jgi:hypothetical protein
LPPARTHAPALRACVRIASDRPSVAGTPTDKRFGNGASDTSKINFKGVHQTGSTPVEANDPKVVYSFVSKFGFWNDIDVVPVIDIGEAVTLTQSSVEWARSSSKG